MMNEQALSVAEQAAPIRAPVPAHVLSEGFWYVLEVSINAYDQHSGLLTLGMDYHGETIELPVEWQVDDDGTIRPVTAEIEIGVLDESGAPVLSESPEMVDLLNTIINKGAPKWRDEVRQHMQKQDTQRHETTVFRTLAGLR